MFWFFAIGIPLSACILITIFTTLDAMGEARWYGHNTYRSATRYVITDGVFYIPVTIYRLIKGLVRDERLP